MGMSQRIHFWYQVLLKMLIFFQKMKKKKQKQKQKNPFFFFQKIFGKAKIESLS